MEILFLSRLQFAIASIYHFLFVPLAIGLSLFVAILETIAYRSGNSSDEQIAMFWNRLFLLVFAVSTVTGIAQQFQFGMNWAEYSIFVGGILGVPIAIEALAALFAGCIFVGPWIFGRSVLPRGVHLACIWIVFSTTCISAACILIANSFMQHPVGYAFNNGRLEMTDFFALISNPYFLHQYPHVIGASICAAAFFIIGISAWKIMVRSNDFDLFEKSFRLALLLGLVGLITSFASGYLQRQSIAKLQPMKLAAMENLKKTANPAPFSIVPGIEVPAMLSIMIHGKASGEIQGIENLQKQMEWRYGEGNYTPPVWLSYISFRLMLVFGFAMLTIVLYGITWHYILGKDMHKKILLLMISGISFPHLANTAGWLITETGRQPWIIYGIMPTEKAVSAGIYSGNVLFSIFLIVSIYGTLAVSVFLLIQKEVLRDHSAKKITKKVKTVVV
ncbi:MAG: cytochrome ubiquinol oxidase subunit I [Fibromonadaceae bacterium]|nr:cytochrome ubiquinol oxidase subunit I [Fibromonadaceae bacterium]